MEIPGYKFIREISRGPVNSVALYRQESLDRTVLMKILHPQFAGDADIVERFKREAKFYARLKHNNIVGVIDFDQQKNSFYIAMEYVDGWTLSGFAQQFAPVSVAVILYISREILSGLSFAHQCKIIHRDIKPSNILIGRDGSVKIADFVLARLGNLPSITAQGGTVGTPAYMSPEQAQTKPVSAISDIFSLGVTLYELLTERSPFAGSTVVESISYLLNKYPENPSSYRNDIPVWLDRLIMRMMAKQPEKRPQSCDEILELFDKKQIEGTRIISAKEFAVLTANPNARTTFPSEVYPAAVPVTPFKPGRKKTGLIVAAVIFLLMVITIGVFLLPEKNPATQIGESDKDQQATAVKPALKDSLPIEMKPEEPQKKTAFLSSVEKQSAADTVSKEYEGNNRMSTADTGTETAAETEPRNGGLFVTALPWANVFIDGRLVDTTPLKNELFLKPGKHILELQNPEYRTYREEIEIEADRSDTIRVKLEAAVGFLMVDVSPWGELYLNGEYLDTTPLQVPAKLERGRYTLVVKNPNFEEYREEIEILPGRTTNRKIFLKN